MIGILVDNDKFIPTTSILYLDSVSGRIKLRDGAFIHATTIKIMIDGADLMDILESEE